MCALDIRSTARPSIGTDRLILRGPTPADAPAIAELANDWGVASMVSRMPYPYALEHAEEWTQRVAGFDPTSDVAFAIEHRELGFMGVLGFHKKPASVPGLNRMELGYWLGRPFWGRGYATEAVEGALRWARADWRRNVVWAGHFAENRASGEVLCKTGFLYTGDVEQTPCLSRGGEPVPTRMMVWLA